MIGVLKVSMVDKVSMFLDDSGVDFTPYKKIADKIDECLSMISYHKVFKNTEDMLKKEEELKGLRDQIKKIKTTNQRQLNQKTYRS